MRTNDSRRNCLRSIAGVIGVSCLLGRSFGWPKPGHQKILVEPKSQPSGRGGSPRASFACTLSAEAASDAQPSLVASSGSSMVDAAHAFSVRHISSQLGVRPAAFFYDDSDSPNAFAVPNVANPAYPDGTVVCGLSLISTELKRDGHGYAVPTILAHEFGHIMQFKYIDNFEGSSGAELHADFMAGWYLARELASLFVDAQSSLHAFFEIGDYEFNSPQHHGTPNERVNALLRGSSTRSLDPYSAFVAGRRYVGI